MHRSVIAIVTSLVIATLTAAIGAVSRPVPAFAQSGGSAVTWSATPADEIGPDGRAWVELELDPGTTITEHLAVRNLGNEEVVFALGAADGYFTSSGRFNMLASGQPSVAAGTWISIEGSVTVAAGETAVIPFTIQVPADAVPGDHAAGVAASIMSTSTGEGAALGVESRVGFRVMTRVTGEITPDIEMTANGEYHMTWNPFEPGQLIVTAELANTGNVRLAVDAKLDLGAGATIPDGLANGQTIELLPDDRRSLRFSIPSVWPRGLIDVPVQVTASTMNADGSLTTVPAIAHTLRVWAVPWPQLIVAAALLLLLVGFVLRRRYRTQQFSQMLADARAAGRTEAQESGSAS